MWRGGRTTSARRTGRSSSGSRAETVSVGQRGPVRPARFVARYGSRPNKFGRSGDETLLAGKGATGAAKFTPRGTTYVFVNVVVAPRYVARVQLGSGGLKRLVQVLPWCWVKLNPRPIYGGGRRRHDPLHAARAQRGVNFCDPPRRALAAAARQWRCRHALTACIDARRQINIVEPLALKNVYVITRVVWSSQSPRRITNSTSKTRRLSWSCT